MIIADSLHFRSWDRCFVVLLGGLLGRWSRWNFSLVGWGPLDAFLSISTIYFNNFDYYWSTCTHLKIRSGWRAVEIFSSSQYFRCCRVGNSSSIDRNWKPWLHFSIEQIYIIYVHSHLVPDRNHGRVPLTLQFTSNEFHRLPSLNFETQ